MASSFVSFMLAVDFILRRFEGQLHCEFGRKCFVQTAVRPDELRTFLH